MACPPLCPALARSPAGRGEMWAFFMQQVLVVGVFGTGRLKFACFLVLLFIFGQRVADSVLFIFVRIFVRYVIYRS